jgi:hypothetical protein
MECNVLDCMEMGDDPCNCSMGSAIAPVALSFVRVITTVNSTWQHQQNTFQHASAGLGLGHANAGLGLGLCTHMASWPLILPVSGT